MNRIESFFKFLSEKQGKEPPLKYKLLYAPETLREEELNVMGNLTLSDNPTLHSLPEGLSVRRTLHLRNTPIQELPNNLKVGQDLYIPNTAISTIPRRLRIGNDFMIENTPLARNYTEDEIRAEIKRKRGYVLGYIRKF